MASEITHLSAAEAAAGHASGMLTLFDEGGRPVTVPAADAEHWIERGFAREPLDAAALVARAQLLADEVARAYAAFVAGVERDGVIDTGDAAELAAAQHALQLLLDAVWDVERAVAARYPVRQGAAVRMQRADATSETAVDVDPGQVALYAAQGWELVR